LSRRCQVANNPNGRPSRAADAAVIHLEDFFVRIDNWLVINSTSPNSLTITATFCHVRSENAIQQRGFARA